MKRMVAIHRHSLRARDAGPGAMLLRTVHKFVAENWRRGGHQWVPILHLGCDIPMLGQLLDQLGVLSG